MRCAWISVLMMFVGGCAGTGSTAPDASGALRLTCESNATTFPALDKQCEISTDCVVVQHTVSCCGTEIAIGIAAASRAAFASAETACAAGYPGCGCAALPTKAEDGRDVTSGTIEVHCVDHLCASFVP